MYVERPWNPAPIRRRRVERIGPDVPPGLSVLWGYAPWQPVPIKLAGGTREALQAEQASRTAAGWTCAVYGRGFAPLGLRIRAHAETGVSPVEAS